MNDRPLWTCPDCRRRFVNAGQWHSCGPWDVESFLAGKGRRARQLFDGFERLVASCGPVLLAPAKTRIGFQVRMIFAAVNSLSDRGLSAHLILPRRIESPRFRRIDDLGGCWVHHVRIESPADLDDELRGWLAEARRVGEGRR